MASRHGLQVFVTDRKQVGGLSRSGRATHSSTRRTIANIRRYQKEAIRGIQREVDKAEIELRTGARAAVRVDTGKARRGIKKRRRKSSLDDSVIQGGIVASARHSLAIEAGTSKRAAKPFFYKQIDVVFPRFEAAVAKVVSDTAVRRAVRG